ncbi:tetratricopeptide repeat protein [Methylicorpusculum sp.]|nr:tetratricopeptide repeat protein [Methylicorpusculum sp.]MDP2177155.1 tetratricopeptide repeat protein [Methylicorpusculum sp.]MDP3531298.1 tetratricopeptide repeat protein [Methylicorpusculum sp.]
MNELLQQGKEYFQAGDFENARLTFERILELKSDHPDALYQSAEVSAKLGNLQQARDYYQKAVKADRKHLMARVKLGQFYLLAGQIDNAEILAKEAAAIDVGNPDAMVLSAGILAAQNNSDAATVKAEAALAKRPGDVPAILLLASLQAKSGKPDKAIPFLLQHVEKNPGDTSLRLMLANLYITTKAFDQALNTLEAIVKLEPKPLIHRKRLALFLMEQNQLDKAEAVLRQAVDDLPDNQQARLNLLDFLAEKRGPEIAESELIPMLEDHPDDFVLKFGLVNLYLTQNLTEKAEHALQEISNLDPSGRQGIKAQIMLARLQANSGRIESAKQLIETLLSANPKELDALTLRGELALAESRLDDAIGDFRNVLVAQPDTINIVKLLATAHQLNRDPVPALENLEKIVRLLPNDENARLDMAELLVKTGKPAKAAEQMIAWLQLNPGSKKALEALFNIYRVQQQWEQARQVAGHLQQAYPDDASGYYLEGMAFQSEGKPQEALVFFAKALSKQTDAVEPLTQLVNSYLQLKQPDQALKILQEMVKQKPEHFIAYNLMGGVFAAANKPAEAIAAFNRVIAIKPEWENPYRNLAGLYINQKEQGKAVRILQQGIDKTGSLTLVSDLAALYHQAGAHDKALALLEDSYKNQPQSAIALNNLVRYLSEQAKDNADLDRAAKLAVPLAKTNNPEMLYTVAVLAYRQGSYDKARELLDKVVGQVPDSASAHHKLGMVYFKQGDNKSAREHLEKAIEKDGQFNGIDEARQTLKTISESYRGSLGGSDG